MSIAQEIGGEDVVFAARILADKLDLHFNRHDKSQPERTLAALQAMLSETSGEEQTATLHYELWKMTQHSGNKEKALQIYQNLYEKTPNVEYRKRIEELHLIKSEGSK